MRTNRRRAGRASMRSASPGSMPTPCSRSTPPPPTAIGPAPFARWDTEAILFSAPDRAGLIEQVRELLSWLKGNSRHTLLDVAYSLNSLREHPPDGARLGLVASSLPELTERLTSVLPRLADPACRSIRDGRGIYYWDEPLLNDGAGGLAFLFPGEGSQYPGMLADLCFHFPEVRQPVRHGRPDRPRPRRDRAAQRAPVRPGARR